MLKLYIKTAWRSLLRNKLFTSLNLFGLAIGIAGAILIAIWLQNMLSYDRFHKDEDQLFVLANQDHFSGELHAFKNTPRILGPTISDAFPEIQEMTRYDYDWPFTFTYQDKILLGKEGSFVDPDFFKMFSFPLKSGNVNKEWKNGKGIILTEDFARSIFGNENAVGKSIKLDSSDYVTVSGVLENFPSNTMFKNDYFLSWEYAKKIGAWDQNWGNNTVQTFVKLVPGTDIAAFNGKIKDFANQHNAHITAKLFAEPLSRNFLYGKDENGQFVGGKIALVKWTGITGILLILIACINFMNLSTAQSEKRAKEVGVKKVIGASRKRIILQFLTESIMLAMAAFGLALIMVVLILPFFNQLIETDLDLHFSWMGWVAAILFTLLVGLLAGSYPAFYLSSFKPVIVLKGTFKKINAKISARSVMVVLQFTVSIIFILSTIMITRNIKFVQDRDMGYRSDGLLYSNISGYLQKNYLPLRNDLIRSGAVTSVSKNMSPITEKWSDYWGVTWTGSTEADKKTDFNRFSTDADLVSTMHMNLIAGRDIDIYKYPADSSAVLLTETSVKTMHLKNPIGTKVIDNGIEWHVVGVIQDFIIELPFDKVKPILIEGPKAWFETIHYRLNPEHPTSENLAKVKKIFEKYNPGFPYEYTFVDKAYADKFKDTQRVGQLSFLFAGLTIFISCLGLFGLITYMAEARTKEIGIRKVLGSSIAGIIGLLSKGFLKLILLAFVIAVPVSLYIMHRWLSNTDYSVNISAWWFVTTAVLAFMIAAVTVSFQAVKAARANPVESLKTE